MKVEKTKAMKKKGYQRIKSQAREKESTPKHGRKGM
jgi:hypothetical protein